MRVLAAALLLRGGLGLYLGRLEPQAPFWPTKGGNLNHSGAALFRGPAQLQEPLWTWEEPQREKKGPSFYMKVFHSSPVIDGAKNVYIQSTTGWVYSLDSRGSLRWEFQTSSGNPGNLALDGSSVYTISDDGTAFAIDAATGRERWRRKVADKAPDDTHSVTVAEGLVLTACNLRRGVTAMSNSVCALDAASGELRWSYMMQVAAGREDALATNQVQSVLGDRVIFSDDFGGLYCLSRQEGQELWRTPPATSLKRIRETHGMEPYGTTATAVLGPDDALYHPFNLEGGRGTLRAHSLEGGQVLWQRQFQLEANVAPAAGSVAGRAAVVLPLGRNPNPLPANGPEQALFTAGVIKPTEAMVLALDAKTGETIWSFTPPPWDGHVAGSFVSMTGAGEVCAPDNFGAPTIGADGTVYVNWSGGYSYALRDADGNGVVDLNDPKEVSSYHHGYGSNGATAMAPGLMVAPTCRKLLAYAA